MSERRRRSTRLHVRMRESGGVIDWNLAIRTARRLTPPGPKIPAAEAASAVEQLRAGAERAHRLVEDVARLHAVESGPGPLVVDRYTWSEANVSAFSALLDPPMEALATGGGKRQLSPWAKMVGGAASATEMGALLAYLSTRVLGQYLTAFGQPKDAARLLLVAPNVVDVERKLDLHPADFRLWVCLHEETHRVQFTAVPWLRDHMHAEQDRLVRKLVESAGDSVSLIKGAVQRAPEAVKPGGAGLSSLVLDAETRVEMDRLNAVMALLEGHADVVMDDVGPAHVPSVGAIRARFDHRREAANPIDLLMRRLIGMEAKMAQYRDGAAFVRAVQNSVGVDGFNAVWTSPETLPSMTEIHDPASWLARVHG